MDTLVQRIKRAMVEHDLNGVVVAKLVKRNPGTISLMLAGLQPIDHSAREKLEAALEFVEATARSAAPLPICFRSWAKIEPLWIAFQEKLKAVRPEPRRRDAKETKGVAAD